MGDLPADSKEAVNAVYTEISKISDTEAYFMESAIFGAAFLVIFLICLLFFKLNLFRTISFKDAGEQAKGGLVAFPAAIALNIVFSYIIGIVIDRLTTSGTNVPVADFSVEEMSPLLFVSMATRMLITAPLFEELIYRGLIIALIKPFNSKLAVFTSAFIFGLMHGNIEQFITAFAGGLLMAYLTVKFNSILPSLIVHALNNLLAMLATVLPADSYFYRMINTLTLALVILGLGIIYLYITSKKVQFPKNQRNLLSGRTCVLTLYLNIFMLAYLAMEAYIYAYSFIQANS